MTQLIATSQWTFYGTGNAQPTLELFTGQLRDLGCTFRAREKVTNKGVLMGLEVVPPTRPLLSVAVHLSIPGVGGEVTIDFSSLSPRDRKAYRKIQLPEKSPVSDLTTFAAITAIDRNTGRTYRNLVRSVLCVLGEFYPRGLAVRHSDGIAFPTQGMRRRMQTEPFDACFVQGRWNFDPDVMEVVRQVVEDNPNCQRMCTISENGLTFRAVETLIAQSAWPALQRDLASLARHANAGRVSITRPNDRPLVFIAGENTA